MPTALIFTFRYTHSVYVVVYAKVDHAVHLTSDQFPLTRYLKKFTNTRSSRRKPKARWRNLCYVSFSWVFYFIFYF